MLPSLAALLGVAAVLAYHGVQLSKQDGLIRRADPSEVARGRVVFDARCASCHGENLEGQPNWRARKPDGRLPAPPHDASGHTWHHPDEVLFAIAKYGLVPPYAPKDYPSDMPAFGSVLPDADIRAALAYIESTWPPDVWKLRNEMLEGQRER
jgi:mono/diheme cytochrome c family protein